jgi:hypothetical protein
MSRVHSGGLQRRAFRREVILACSVVRERDFRLVSSLAIDLSEGGMLVAADVPVFTGEEVIVSFRGPRSDRWFDQQAVVARVIHGRRPGDRGPCLGLSFEGMDAATRTALGRHLRGLPPPDPARPWPFARPSLASMAREALRAAEDAS